MHDTNTFHNVGRKTLYDTNTFHNVRETLEDQKGIGREPSPFLDGRKGMKSGTQFRFSCVKNGNYRERCTVFKN